MSALVVVYFVIGAVLGAIHLTALRWTVSAYVTGGLRARIVALHAVRLLLVGFVFFLLARWGRTLVLAALAGFTLVRLLVARRVREDS
jgi:F1F0 ATPase subunit 2